MAKKYSLKAEQRDRAGKGVARALRRENKIPAVIYGDKKEPVNVSMSAKEVNIEYRKGHMYTTLCDVDVDGAKHTVLARDVQLHPVTDNVLHVDFLRVTPKTRIAVNVPVQFVNEDKCPGLVDEKGTLNVVRYEVELHCSATSIPDSIEVDMTSFKVGDAIKISDVTLPAGAKPVIDDRDFTIATIAAPRTLAAEAEEEEAEGAEAEAAEGAEAEGGEAEGEAAKEE